MTEREHEALTLHDWLREREQNSRTLAMDLPGAECAGWLEDAEYYRHAAELASQAERQAATVPPELPEESALLKLARRTLWIAYVWNDHNFDAAHTYARTVAKECGITNFEDARAWLEAAASIGMADHG